MRKTFLAPMLLLILLSVSLAFNKTTVRAILSVHNLDTGKSFSTIQEAIDDSETLDGHTILVGVGIYNEHITIYKSLELIGERRDSTVVDGDGSGNVVTVTADHVRIEGFTVRNGGPGPDFESGIRLSYVQSCNVVNNIIEDNRWGIYMSGSKLNHIIRNEVANTQVWE